MVTQDFENKTRQLIDSLKGICASYGLGNDGNEFKIITQVFLYKFLNDKFAFEAKRIDPSLIKADSWEKTIAAMSEDKFEMLQFQMGADTARLKPEHFISHLFSLQNAPDFAKLFDDTLRDIAIFNNEIFEVDELFRFFKLRKNCLKSLFAVQQDINMVFACKKCL